MRWGRWYWLRVAILLLPALDACGDAALSPEEKTLRAAGFQTDAPALLDFFRRRTRNEANRARIVELVRQLGDKSFAIRERASSELTGYGPGAVEFLSGVLKDRDLEVARRAERCLRHIAENGSEAAVTIAAVRLVTRQRAPGVCEVLLVYLLHADDPLITEEVRAALGALALRDGQPEPSLVAALSDRTPARRAAAAEAFCRAGGIKVLPDLHKFLRDPDAGVRLRVALALAATGEKNAVPVLINLLAELPLDQAFLAEDALLRLADEQSPQIALNGTTGAQTRCRDVWSAWWRTHADRVDLTKLRQTGSGRILIAQWDNGQVGRIVEMDAQGRVLWQTEQLPWPLDAQVLPGNRLLLTEFYDNRVSERNAKGELLWEKALAENPVAAQRLPNGNTFIATRTRLLEVDRAGKELTSHLLAHALLAAQKCRDGSFACLTSEGTYLRLDAAGKEVNQFPAGAQNYCGFDVLPGGRVLIPQEGRNQVVEFSADGKTMWTAAIPRPISVARLANGNVLVACRDGQRVVELDVAGRIVREFKAGGYPWRARPR